MIAKGKNRSGEIPLILRRRDELRYERALKAAQRPARRWPRIVMIGALLGGASIILIIALWRLLP